MCMTSEEYHGVLEEDTKHPQYGLYRFKKGFNAEFTEFIGQVYLPISPLRYKVFMFAQKVNRRINGSIKKQIKTIVKKILRKGE